MSEALLPMEAPKDRPAKEGVRGCVGLHPATIYAEIKAGRFPKPVKFGRSSRWVESEIEEWIAARVRERDVVNAWLTGKAPGKSPNKAKQTP